MEYYTYSKQSSINKIAKIRCIENDKLDTINIKNKAFLMMIVLEGHLTFKINSEHYTACAPSFICFDEKENPQIIKKWKLKVKTIYFHPQFLNINMSFDFIRSPNYNDVASEHDLFLLKPFTDDNYIIPIIESYLPRIITAFEGLHTHLTVQPDWLWTCRSRSEFIDILMALEKHYQMLLEGEILFHQNNNRIISENCVKKALLYIESNYMRNISFDDILKASDTNHTTLTKNFKKETGQTVMNYLKYYRVEVAKQKLRFTDVPLKDISKSCGFSTTEHFSRIFSSFTDLPPAAFRKRAVERRINEITRAFVHN